MKPSRLYLEMNIRWAAALCLSLDSTIYILLQAATYNSLFFCMTGTSLRVKSWSSTWRSSRGRRARVLQLRALLRMFYSLGVADKIFVMAFLLVLSSAECYAGVLQTWWAHYFIMFVLQQFLSIKKFPFIYEMAVEYFHIYIFITW